jgi:hypothetical protein
LGGPSWWWTGTLLVLQRRMDGTQVGDFAHANQVRRRGVWESKACGGLEALRKRRSER